MATEPTLALNEGARRRSRRSRRGLRLGTFRWQVAFIVILLCLWEGFPSGPLGITSLISYQAFAAIVFAGVPLYFLRVGTGRIIATYWEILALALFGLCVAVSAIYSGIVDPLPFREWVPAVYTVAPVLSILLLKAIGAELRDSERALYFAGVAASILVAINSAVNLHILDFYIRGSAFGTEERVVFFKIESTFALVIVLVRLAYARSALRLIASALAVIITFYNVFVLSESRLAIGAVLIALMLIWLFVMRGGRKLFFLLFGPVVVIPVLAYVLERYMRASTTLVPYFRSTAWAAIAPSRTWNKISGNEKRIFMGRAILPREFEVLKA